MSSCNTDSQNQISFASDNYAGIIPEVLDAIARCNSGHARSYGADDGTAAFDSLMEATFGTGAVAFPVFNGTAANVLALTAVTRRWGAVICAESAHVHADEGGAPEAVVGIKLWTVATGTDGKLTPSLLAAQLFDTDSVHRANVAAVTIAQTTEMGTLYTPAEVRALADAAHAAGLVLHMDGARLANAAAALNLPMRAFTTDAGVDVLSLGGTKAGALAAEAVVLLPGYATRVPSAVSQLPFLRKTVMQLASKQRFLAAQLIALFSPPQAPVAVVRAAHANAMAARLERGLRALPYSNFSLPKHSAGANAVFPTLPKRATEALLEKTHFYVWNHATGQVRFMTSWDTTEADIDALVAAVDEALKESALSDFLFANS